MMNKKIHRCFCGGEVEICKKTLGSGTDGCYQNWEICCKKCGGNWQWAADEFYGRDYYSKDEVIDLWNEQLVSRPCKNCKFFESETVESIPYLMHKEMGIPLIECKKAYNLAIEYLRDKARVKG